MEIKKINSCSFFDETVLSLELKQLFSHPSYAGHRLMVPDHGDYFALPRHQETKILLNRNQDPYIMSNICRHRNAKMLDKRGSIDSIVCPIHRWTYDLEGTLIGAPHFLNTPSCQLQSTKLLDWNGLLFEDINEKEILNLKNNPFIDYFSLFDYSFHSLDTHICNYNWKTFIEVYLDDYHVAPFHPGLSSFVNCKYLDWFFCDTFSVQAVSFNSSTSIQSTKTYKSWKSNVVRYKKNNNLKYGAIWMLIYPNIMLEWYPQTIVVSHIYPLDPQKTLNITEFYYSEEIASFYPEYIDSQKSAYKETVKEDDEIAERIDRGRKFNIDSRLENSGINHPILEKGIPQFYKYLRNKSQPNLKEKYFETFV